jgi:hypothetical protein
LLLPLVLALLGRRRTQRQWAAELVPRPVVHRLGLAAPRRYAKRGLFSKAINHFGPLWPGVGSFGLVEYVPSWDA